MKRIFSAILVVCMIFSAMASMSVHVFAADTSSPRNIFYAKYIGELDGEEYEGQKPTIDGIINADEWVESDFQGWPKDDNHKIAFYYDETDLYVGVKIKNEEINIPWYPNYWWVATERFELWIDPYDEAMTPDDGAKYFLNFCTQYAEGKPGGNGSYGTYLFETQNVGVEVPPLLNYYSYESVSNMDTIFNNWIAELTPEKPEDYITYEGDKPWGMETPNGEWTFEYKIPFGIMNILSVEDDIQVTDTEEYGTYITFSGWYVESGKSVKENVINNIYKQDEVNVINTMVSGNMRNSWNFAATYFSHARPGQKPDNPDSKSLGDINPSGEAERTAEEADGAAKEAVAAAPRIDGKLDDNAWDLKKMVSTNPSNEFDSYYDIQWDANYLYIAVDTGDTSVTTPEAIDFENLNKIENPASYDFVRLDIDPTSSRQSIDVADRAFSIYLPRAAAGEEEYAIAMSGVNWGTADFKKGLVYNADMKVKYTNALTEGESWKAEIAIPWSMFDKEEDKLFPDSGNKADFYGKDVEVFVAYSNSYGKTEIVEKEVVSGEEIVYVTAEETTYTALYNSSVDGAVGMPYRYPFLRMVEDAGEYSKTVTDKTVSYKADTKYLEQNTYALIYNFDGTGYDKAEVEIPVTSLNRQNYTSYYINMDDGIRVEIPSGLVTNNLIKEDKDVSKTDKVVFTVSKTSAPEGTEEFYYPEVTFTMKVNGKTVNPETPVKITYPLDIEVPTTEYEAYKLQLKDEEGEIYPLSNVKFTDRYGITVNPETNTETEKCIERSYVVKTTLSGVYSMVENMKTAGDIEGWYKPFVEKVMKTGLMKGYDEGGIIFKPTQNISRAEVATLVMRITQKSVNIDEENLEKFSDVGENDWYKTMVYRAKTLGYVSGTGNGKFEPMTPITRGDFFTLIERALTKMDIKFNELDHAGFSQTFRDTDYNMFSESMGGRYSYAYAGAVFCYSNGLATGSTEPDGKTYMRPERPITRGEISKLVAVLMDDFIVPQANK